MILAAILCAPEQALAQYARRDVPAGEVTGLEVGVDGSLSVVPGGTLRWFVNVYEVVHSRDLRPSAGTRVAALASFSRGAPVAEATTDALGRAQIVVPVPATLDAPFEMALDATSPRGLVRRFDVQVELLPRREVTLVLGREEVSPGEALRVLGRVIDRAAGRPDPSREVGLRIGGDGAANRASWSTVRTDARGVFRTVVRAPREVGPFIVTAVVESAPTVTASAVVDEAPAPPSLVVRAAPSATVVPPGAVVQVDVVIRTPDGRPVAGAVLGGLSIPEPHPARPGEPEVLPVRTGPDGRARVPWQVPSTAGDPSVTDHRGDLRAVRAGIGAADTEVVVRVARVASVLEWAVEGGAFAPGLPGRMFVRVVAPDGSARAGETVQVTTGDDDASVDSLAGPDGVAVVDLPAISTEPAGSDSCSGPTVLRLDVRVGSHAETLCAPVDPDATLRVEAPPISIAPAPLPVTLIRAGALSRAPVRVTALARRGEGWVPVADALAGAGVDRVALEVTGEITGEIWIRARPLLAGGEPVRGGGILVYRIAAQALRSSLAVEGRLARLALSGAGDDPVTAFAFTLAEPEGRALVARLREGTLDPVGTAIDEGATIAGVRGLLAARTPVDVSAPAALRSGTTEPLPMPDSPVSQGLLRDPWRTRARFVRGRLGRLMRALEARVREHLPDRVREVAARTARGHAFNTEVLAHVVSDIGPEGATSLDGSELTVEALAALDPQITFDNVARRITRERLFRLLVHLAHFVRSRDLDYGFARKGDPTRWLPALLAEGDWEGDEPIERDELFDGWGRPLVIRPAAGGRARFRFVEPLIGFEVVSAGPDGRAGNADDFWDPFARVLRPGVYASAVGEDVLLARLRGVELGRATVAALAGLFELEPTGWADDEAASARVSWGEGPARLPVDPHPLRARPAGGRPAATGAVEELGPEGGSLPLTLPEEPRRLLVVGGAFGSAARASFAAVPIEAGAPILLSASLPRRMHPGERIRATVRLAWLAEPRTLGVTATARGAIAVSVEGASATGTIRVSPDRPAVVTLSIRGTRTGVGEVRLAVGEGPLRTLTAAVSVVPQGALRARHDGAVVHGSQTLAARLPDDARPVRAQLVLAASSAGLERDPGLAGARRRWPALFAWSSAMRGEASGADLDLRATGGETSALSSACALVASSFLAAEDERNGSRGHQLRALALPEERDLRMALLVALSGAAPGLPAGGPGSDPVAAVVGRLREEAWSALETDRANRGLIARAAAGLLLADPRDGVGRRLVQHLGEDLAEVGHGGRTLNADPERPGDEWIGTLALAIAARQIAEDALADDLARGAAPRAYLAMQDDEEAAFWWLAASLLGVFGSDAPRAVEVRIAGAGWRSVPIEGGLAVVGLPAADARVEIKSPTAIFARLEARWVRPVQDGPGGPLRATIEGDPGHAGEAAALEIVVASTSDRTLERPVVELLLPGTAALDAAARRSLASSTAVARVDLPDAAGLLRVHLSPLAPREELRIPLAVRWIGEGRTIGFPIVAYDAARPHETSSTAGRPLSVTARPEERWQ
ncbi:MAG: hypothetical protein HYY06_16610 [Deltaproteobacteria bacterium]|nr:hypothetical protein [Deltaproteobacteria bacterium]